MDPLEVLSIGLTTVAIGAVSGGIFFFVMKKAIRGMIFELANDYLAEFAEDVQKSPQKYVDLLKPLFGVMLKGFTGADGSGKPQYFKFGPIRVPATIIEPFMPMIADFFRKKAGNPVTEAAYSLLEP